MLATLPRDPLLEIYWAPVPTVSVLEISVPEIYCSGPLFLTYTAGGCPCNGTAKSLLLTYPSQILRGVSSGKDLFRGPAVDWGAPPLFPLDGKGGGSGSSTV